MSKKYQAILVISFWVGVIVFFTWFWSKLLNQPQKAYNRSVFAFLFDNVFYHFLQGLMYVLFFFIRKIGWIVSTIRTTYFVLIAFYVWEIILKELVGLYVFPNVHGLASISLTALRQSSVTLHSSQYFLPIAFILT